MENKIIKCEILIDHWYGFSLVYILVLQDTCCSTVTCKYSQPIFDAGANVRFIIPSKIAQRLLRKRLNILIFT